MLVVEYEQKFSSLVVSVSWVQLTNEEKSRMYKDNLSQRYKNMVLIQMKATFRKVVYFALIAQRNWLASQ